MKKLNKLFAILIAVLGVNTLSAQTDVTSTYLTNANFSSTSGWTQYVSDSYRDIGSGNIGGALGSYAASTTDASHLSSEHFFAFQCRWNGNYASYNQETAELPAGVYTLSYDVENRNGSTTAAAYNNLFYVKVGDKTFTDTSVEWMKGSSSWTAHSITFVITESTKATVSLGYGTGSNNFASANTPVLYVSHLKLTHRELDDISSENTADLTSYIVNNSFETSDLTGWTCNKSSDTAVYPNSNGTYTTSGVDGNYLFNTWWRGVPLTQTVTNLPNGNYTVHVLVASGDGSGSTPDIFLLANGEHSDVYTITDGDKTKFHDISFDFKITNGQATIGVVGGNDDASYTADGHWWYKADNFRLTYKGADVSLLQEVFAANYAKLETLSTNNVPTAFTTQITNLKSTYATMPSSKADLNTANAKMEAIIALHPSIVSAYANLNSLITLCTNYASDSYSNVQDEAQRTTFTTAITTANTNGNKATTVAELTEVYNTLETARQTFVLVAYPTSGNSFDMTFKITNPSFETGDLTGWTIVQPSSDTGVKPNSNATYATTGVDGNYLFNTYWQGVPIKQTLADLPTGTYTLTVAVASDGGTVYLTADDEHSAGQMTSDKTVFIDTSIEFLCTDGETTIGVVGGADGDAAAHKEFTEDGYWWYKADNFRLVRSFDASTLQSSLTALKNTAATLLTQPMDPSKKSALQIAYNNADATSDNPFDLGDWSLALEKAIADAQSSANDYAKIQEYIDKTKVFVDASEMATYQTKHDNCEYTSADVETVRRELNVIRFNAASEVFTNKVEVKDWTGDLANGIRSDQHWSGNTQNYYDANSWVSNFVGLKHTLSTTVTLPNGTYVLKAAGRSSADATLRLTIKDGDTVLENVEYTGKDDTGYGIDTSGAANFSDEGTYANNDAGRGWEWEFAKFELAAETEVTLHVEVDYNNIQNRFGSFSDITLWMDDATYVTVYGKELDAPLAEAKALVNTLPMGTDENTALTNAIAVGEGELSGPDELNTAVDGLKTAVNNANAWRSTYYAEKDKLVAALERFEADYNDAQNGALDYMCKSRWATAISMAQAAAEAKDVTDSYDGFATATGNLIAALDAATVSIGEYADLKAAIETVAPLYNGGNWGDQPFQRPTSAKESLNTTTAQATYDAATADGEAVTSLTEALNKGINITLNAPEEGQRFHIKVATEGHSKLGNAVLATLGTAGDNNPTGYGLNANNAVKGHLAQAFIFTQVEGNLYNISIERPEGTVYLTYGSLNGSAAGWKNQQIQATTDAAKRGEFKIEATAKDGVLKILNTVDNNYLDCQDGGSIYTDTDISAEEFNFALAPKTEVTLNLSKVGWATLILPFDAELPEGVKAWSCSEANGDVLELVGAERIVANTPYLMNGYEGTHTFTGYGLADKDSYTAGLFTGTYVDYATTAGSNTYVLQNNDGEVAFYLVGESAQPTVRSNRIYMTYDAAAGAPMFRIGHGTTAIESPVSDAQGTVLIYDLMGRKVTTMEKGGIYIINGIKVVIK